MMKGVGLLLCFLFVPISASIYDELHGAMHSIEQGFGKLLSDVVIDVTDTVHCTISAVEHVLTLNGLMKSKSEYGHKCRDGPLPFINNDDDPLQNFRKLRDAIEERTFKETGVKDLSTSIAKVNTTLSNVLDNHENQRKMESISKVLKDETDQLTKVSHILRKELNSISNNVNTELEKFEHTLGPSVWTEMEKKRNNQVNTAKIHHTRTNEASQKIGSENKDGKNQNSLNKVKREFEQLRDDVRESANIFPKTFKEVAQNIRDNKDSNKQRFSTGSVFNVDESNFDSFSPFYDPGTGDRATRKNVVEETVNIISESQRNEEIMKKIINEAHVSSVFSANPGMFNF